MGQCRGLWRSPCLVAGWQGHRPQRPARSQCRSERPSVSTCVSGRRAGWPGKGRTRFRCLARGDRCGRCAVAPRGFRAYCRSACAAARSSGGRRSARRPVAGRGCGRPRQATAVGRHGRSGGLPGGLPARRARRHRRPDRQNERRREAGHLLRRRRRHGAEAVGRLRGIAVEQKLRQENPWEESIDGKAMWVYSFWVTPTAKVTRTGEAVPVKK